MKKKIKIILPPIASSNIDLDLVNLTEFLSKKIFKDEFAGGFGFGGQYGYGCNYENNVFMIHQFCWCEKDDCKWCNGKEPNFRHKKSGLEIKWYKWIGRDMEFNEIFTNKKWKKVYEECIKSLTNLCEKQQKKG